MTISTNPNLPPRTNVLGVGISALNLPQAVEIISGWVDRRETGHFVCVTGMHGVMESQKNEPLRVIHNRASLVTPDGMPMVWLSRWNGHRQVSRVYGPDLMASLSEASARKGYRQYYYGGNEGVPELLAEKLKSRFGGLQVAGTFSPPFRKMSSEEDAALIERIEAAAPDILWVGLSTPKQEMWMAEHAGRIRVPVMIGVGAAFDFHAGLKKQAPRWMQRSGLEWFYRLVSEPGRLWKRYVINIPRFMFLVFLQKTGLRRFPSIEG